MWKCIFIFLGVGLLGHMLNFKKKKLPNFSKVIVLFIVPLVMYEGYSCSRLSSKPDVVSLFFVFLN